MKRTEMMKELKKLGVPFTIKNTSQEMLAILQNAYKTESDNNNVDIVEEDVANLAESAVSLNNILVGKKEDEDVMPRVELKNKIVTNPYDLKQFSFYEKKVYNERVEIWKSDGTYVRTYSRRDHGMKFADLADEFLCGRMLRLQGQILGDY